MAYEPTTWQCGDVITPEAMNKIEQGIADASAPLKVSMILNAGRTEYTMNRTWQEINDAFPNVIAEYIQNDGLDTDGTYWYPITQVLAATAHYDCIAMSLIFETTSTSGYPVHVIRK